MIALEVKTIAPATLTSGDGREVTDVRLVDVSLVTEPASLSPGNAGPLGVAQSPASACLAATPISDHDEAPAPYAEGLAS